MKQHQLAPVILTALALLLLIPLLAHAYLGLFTRPMADDYTFAAAVQMRGFWEAQKYWYERWAGRFAYSLIISATTWLLGTGIIPYLPVIALGLWIAVLTWAINSSELATYQHIRVLASFVLAELILVITLNRSPNVAQSLYWQAGMLLYVAPLVLLTTYAALVMHSWRKTDVENRRSLPALVVGTILVFVAGGFNEVQASLQTGLLTLAILVTLVIAPPSFKRCSTPLLIAATIGSILAMAIMFIAPGNKFRQAIFAPSPSLPSLIQASLGYSLRFVDRTVTRFPTDLLISLALAILVALQSDPGQLASSLTPKRRQLLIGSLIALPVLTFIFIVACFAPTSYGLSAYPPGRVRIIPQFVFTCTSVCWGYLIGLAIGQNLASRLRLYSLLSMSIPALVIWVALYSFNSTQYTLAQLPSASNYATLWDYYDDAIRSAQQQGFDSLEVLSVPNIAALDSPGPTSHYWVNKSISDYYGLKVLAYNSPDDAKGVLDGSSPFAPHRNGDLRWWPGREPFARQAKSGIIETDASIGDVARLLGYKLDRPAVHSGQPLAVTIYWQPITTTDRPYTVFVHLYKPGTGIIAQHDAQPGADTYPTTHWIPDQPFVEVYWLRLPLTTLPAGPAKILVGLYDVGTGQRLAVTGRDAGPPADAWVELGTVQILP